MYNFKVGEMLHKRTPNSKTWMNFDGSYTTEIHSGVVHYEDEHGNLHNINTDLYDEADFDIIEEPISCECVEGFKQARTEAKTAKTKMVLNRDNHNFRALKVPFDAQIPRNFQRGYSIGKGKDRLTFIPIQSSPSYGEINASDRSKIVYQDVWNDTDVELKVLPNGLKETLWLKTDKSPTTFKFEVQSDVGNELQLAPAWLRDAEGTERDVDMVVDGEFLTLSADVEGLVFPVEIDPTIIVNDVDKIRDTYASSSSPASNYGNNSTFRIGVNLDAHSYSAYVDFDLSNIPKGAFINNATLELTYIRGTWSSNVSYFDIDTGFIRDVWEENTLTWNNRPTAWQSHLPIEQKTRIPKTSSAGKKYSFNVNRAVEEYASNNEYHGIYLIWSGYDGNMSNSIAEFASKEHETPSYRPRLEVTFNVPPTKPTLQVPNGGESWNELHTISWTPSTDEENDPIVYEVQLSTNNGADWKTIGSNITGTSSDYDFINEAESSLCLIRVRAYDGTSYSEWDVSDGVFAIQHNKAPDEPSNLTPSNGEPHDQAKTIRLSWQYNDPNGDDPQSKYELQWRVQGTSNWELIENSTSTTFYNAPGGMFPNGYIEWRVRTYDQEGLPSPWSEIALFYAGNKPSKPEYIYPTNNDVPVANPTIQWSSSGQQTYTLRVLENGVEVYSHTGNTNKAHTIQYDLQNQTMYELRLSITNADGLQSDEAVTSFFVSYTPPPKAIVDTFTDKVTITLVIENPTPTGTEPVITHNDIYRKQGTEWIRIAERIPTNTDFTDYTPASGKTYEYRVRAWGDNGTYRDSDVVSESVRFNGVWLHDVTDSDSLYNFKADGSGRESNWGVGATNLRFAGRKHPVTYFDEQEDDSVTVTLQILRHWNDLQALERIIKAKNIVCYRDGRGRRIFGTINALPVADTTYGYEVTITVIATSYKEEV